MARYEYYNYLLNLPTSGVYVNKRPNEVSKFLRLIVMSDNNTIDSDLIEFRYKLISLIIDKISKYGTDFLYDDYLKIRNNLSIIKEDIIKDNKDNLIDLLNSPDKMINNVKKLDDLYKFNARYERVKVDNKYEIKKKPINKYDFLLYIKEFSGKSKMVAGKIAMSYNPSSLSSQELEKIINELDSDEVLNKMLEFYDEEFFVFKNCKIDIFEYLYHYYKKEVLGVVKNTLIEHKKNKYRREFYKKNEMLCYVNSVSTNNLYRNNIRKIKL